MNAKRTRVFLEIATIEKQYVSDLLFVINEFKQPLVRERIITPAESGKIFSNIETICKIHLSINESLRNHRKLWGLKSSIAECFIDEVSKLEAYKTYIPPFDEAMELLRTLRTTNPQFNKFLKTMEGSKKMRHMELPDLLIKPVQRIPRYILLFREYLKFTPPNHPDYELVPKLIHYLDSTLRDINSFRRRSINEAKINFLQSSVSGANLSGLTEYAMEGELLRVNVTNPVKMYVFLFDEMFIMAKQSPEKSDTAVISSISSRISKFLNTKTYRFKLRKTIKVPNIISVSSDDQDAEGKSFRLTVARKGMKHEIAQRVSSKRADFKVYHFKTQSEKLQMTWTGTITKLLLQYQTQIARAQTW